MPDYRYTTERTVDDPVANVAADGDDDAIARGKEEAERVGATVDVWRGTKRVARITAAGRVTKA